VQSINPTRIAAVALIECPECQKSVSDNAAACPHCGHPIAGPPPLPPPLTKMLSREDRKARTQRNVGLGCGLFLAVIIAFLFWAVNEGSKIQEAEHANPTCATDYTKCKDNAELVSRYMTKKDKLFITVACSSMAKKIAKYGEPELPFFAFGNYPPGRSFIDSGTATLLEPDAGYKNAFNATEKVLAKCNYDLKNDVASVELIRK
jgi:hypothetical protein